VRLYPHFQKASSNTAPIRKHVFFNKEKQRKTGKKIQVELILAQFKKKIRLLLNDL